MRDAEPNGLYVQNVVDPKRNGGGVIDVLFIRLSCKSYAKIMSPPMSSSKGVAAPVGSQRAKYHNNAYEGSTVYMKP